MRARWPLAVTVALVLVPRIASVARAPNIVAKTFDYRGVPARTFAMLLELPLDRATVATFELSESDEHRALPERDAALRDPNGFLSDLQSRTSTMIRQTATWDARAGTLRLEGYVADMATAYPHLAGPQFSFTSPGFAKDHIPAGWRALFVKLLPLPAVREANSTTDRRTVEIALEGDQRASATLIRWDTWNPKNEPIEQWFVSISFGPTIASVGMETAAPKPGGCSR